MTDVTITDLKHQLIEAWDRPEDAPATALGQARFQAVRTSRRPRAGLAIGHARDRQTGKTRLELRVTAAAGPNLAHARKIAAVARSEGVEAEVRTVHRPVIRPAVRANRAPATPPTAAGTMRRCRPLHLGLSVAHERGSAGSLGAFVRTPEGHVGILSCTHVLARGGKTKVEVGDRVHQPGPADQDPFLPGNSIGYLTEHFAPFIRNQVNNLDAAVARIEPAPPLGSLRNLLPGTPGSEDVPAQYRNRPIGPTLSPDDIEIGTRVVKFGRTSGFTDNAKIGAIEFVNLTVSFDSEEDFTFSSAIELQWDGVAPFTLPGDSGALVVTQDGLRPIGLHFAASEEDRLSYVMPMKRICDTFGLTLL